MKIKINIIKKLLFDILKKNNFSKEDAQIITDEYLEGELQGKHSHGLMAFPSLINKSNNQKTNIEIKKQTNSYIFIDAKGGLGNLVGQKYTKEAIKMANKNGVAVVFIKNMISWLRPATIAQQIAENNMIGLVINSGGKSAVAPPNGFQSMIGTNPIGIGIPAKDKNVIIDMATSKRAWGEVRKALAHETLLPSETYLNKKGEFTNNPNQADSVVPFGDYKGFSLGMFIEIMCGSFIGMPMSLQPTDGDNYRTALRGAMILVLNPAFSANLNNFKNDNQQLVNKIKKSKKRKGFKVILIPGERGLNNKKKNLKNGYLSISAKLWKTLKELD